jgi:hypothetical protein
MERHNKRMVVLRCWVSSVVGRESLQTARSYDL